MYSHFLHLQTPPRSFHLADSIIYQPPEHTIFDQKLKWILYKKGLHYVICFSFESFQQVDQIISCFVEYFEKIQNLCYFIKNRLPYYSVFGINRTTEPSPFYQSHGETPTSDSGNNCSNPEQYSNGKQIIKEYNC